MSHQESQKLDNVNPLETRVEDVIERGDNDFLDDNHDQDEHSESSQSHQAVDESDSSEDEVAPRNTIGDVPLEWYKDEKHIGYDIAGRKITKKERRDKLDSFLASADDSKNWRKIYDEYNDEEVELTKEEIKHIRRLLKGKAPHAEFDPYAPYVDWFKWDDAKHPLSNAPEPKRRFIPSKWESKKVVEYVRAIRKGLIKFDQPKEEPRFYRLWGDDSSSADRTKHLAYIPPPKPKLPGHEESYNPSLEYIPTQEEINSYQLMYEEDRPKFIPKKFTSFRSIPAYENAIKDSFERCLDLYLCPRVRKKRINIDPESLKPKLPSRKDLRPYPSTCYLEYRGHEGAVLSISVEPSGQWIASGSKDGTVRIWEVETGRCLRVWEIGEAVQLVAWNPLPELPVLAASVGADVLILNTGFGNEEEQKRVKELLHIGTPTSDDSDDMSSFLSWIQDEKYDCIRLRHYRLSKRLTQRFPFKLHGLPVSSVFHPTRSIFFVATKKNVRVYDLLRQKLIKKLETQLREVSSIAVHPAGDNLIVGSKEGKLCWFDMDLSSKPYKTLKCHPKDITKVAFHRSYPLFASCSDDCTAYIFHGMVYADLNQNPLIVPLEILRGHTSYDGRGVMDCKFHPRQPWLFTAGADSSIKLYCH
ncbi:Ribosome biogenesis BOP1 [Gossypium arboreum]|uniref:Ribosome biogenesis protein BOP1 homolog n=1 Tax=Gossypium arboreum TaxID=29729 RepID=A0A0B0N5R4_GOSAR|nr:Ribosome biogenesis BOP1 [Gossypium arboreum]